MIVSKINRFDKFQGRKKRPFIDKKNSVTFRLVNRSQQDPLAADEKAPQHVLLPISKNKHHQTESEASTSSYLPPEKRRMEQNKFGVFFDDEYDYLQHLKEPGRNELFWEEVPNKKTDKDVKDKPKLQLPSSVFASEFEEDEGLLNRAAPKGLCLDWDPDVVAAMDEDFDFDNPDNFLEDNFMELANGGKGDEQIELNGDDDEEWDDESDVDSNAADFSDFDEEDDEVGDLPIMKNFANEETKSRFTDYSMTSSVLRRNQQLTMLDDQFERFYETYDDPEVGDLECEEIEGHIELGEDMIEEFTQDLKKEHQPRQYETSKDTCRLTKMKDYENEEEEIVELQVEEHERNEKGEKKKKWDCESYLSNYSNIYNHPKLIEVPPKRSTKIKINQKTGLPSDAFDQSGKLTQKSLARLQNDEKQSSGPKSLCAESVISTLSVLSIRPKDETDEERRERKKLLKEYRKERRIEKKLNREAFNEERLRQKLVDMNRKNMQGNKIV